jgi:hypothetical protein
LVHAVVERLALIGDDQIQVEVDGVAESLAARTRSVRIVEREKPGLGFLVKCAVILAFESFVEGEPLGGIPRIVRDKFENGFALPFAVANFDGVNEPRARLRIDGETVDQDVDRFRKIDVEQRFRRGEFVDSSRLVKPVETALLEIE